VKNEIVKLPAVILPEHAVIGHFPVVSMTSIIQKNIRPTEPVIVTELGVVGLMRVQMIQHCGYKVFAIDPNQKCSDVAHSCGLLQVYSRLSPFPSCAAPPVRPWNVRARKKLV
jgi:D-arabinose 1-dehydrogenase-like Zn-dependent alcohol dehydrogenase